MLVSGRVHNVQIHHPSSSNSPIFSFIFFVGKSFFCFTLASHSLIPGVLSSCKNGKDNGKRTGGSRMSNVQGASLRNLQRLQTVLKPQLVGGK